MSSHTQKVGIPVLAIFGLLLVLLAPGAAPAAAQEDPNDGVTLIWVVDEWDGEVMTGRSEAPPEGEGEGEGEDDGEGEGEGEGDGDEAVDEWDGEVMTGRSSAPRVVVLVVAPSASPSGDAAVDEWDGEVMTGRAVTAAAGGAAAGQCQLRVNGAARSFRVLRAVGLSGGKVLSLPQPVRRAPRQR
ncbi:MAG TPA: hypothetical protein VEG34_05360 [Thermoanaerobaculia bacterium]|nr:hypothetical protein [Thermoanaerobaculia bacterium]